MKLVDLITTSDCKHIYQRYFKIIADPKLPHQITSKEIYQEIVTYYNDSYQNILDILCQEEIDFLSQLNTRQQCRKDIPIINSLINKCLLIKNPYDDNYLEIPEDIKDNVILAIKLADKQKINKIDQINELLIGILATRGIIEPQELINIYLKYDPSLTYQQLSDHLNNNHYLFQHYFIYQGDSELLMAYEPYHPIVQEIEQLQSLINKVEFNYTNQQLRLIGRYSFDLSQLQIAKLYDMIEALDNIFLRELLKDSIILYCQIHSDINDLIKIIKELAIDDIETISNIEEQLKIAAPLIHSASFYGLAPYDYYLLMNQNSFFSEQESSLFYQLYLSLLEYTNQTFKISNFSIKELEYIDGVDFSQVRTLFFSHPEIVDQYIKDNPDHLTNYELDIINHFKDGIIDEFLILNNTDDYSIISNEHNVFAVYGLVNHLKELYPNSTLPQVCNLAILPYKHKIVFDGLLDDECSTLSKNQIRHYLVDDILYELPNNLLN